MNNFAIHISYKTILLISLIFMSFFTAPIFSYSPIRFSDVGVLLIIFIGVKSSSVVSFSYIFKLWVAFVVIAIVNTLVHLLFFSGFDLLNAFISLFRLVLGVLAAILVVNFSKKISFSSLSSILVSFVTFHCVIILLYALMFYVLGLDSFFKIVTPGEERNRLITENYLFLNHFRIVISSGFYYRLSGVFEEPAWFGWVVTLFCSFILQIQFILKKKLVSGWFWILVFTSYIFTVSVSAVVGLLFLIFVYLFSKYGAVKRVFVVFLFSFVLGVIYFVLPDVIFNRVSLILSGGDGSTSSRVIGSINGAINSISTNPFIGSGLGDGNRVIMYKGILDSGNAIGMKTADGSFILDMHNIFLSVISSLGIPGGLIFTLIVILLIYHRLWILLSGYFIIFMSVNVFDSYLFLVSWGLVYLLFMKGWRHSYV